MTDAEYEAIKSSLDAYVDSWKERLQLRYWEVKCVYYRSATDYAASNEDVNSGGSAHCVCSWQYMEAALHFNVEAIFADSEPLEELVVHELVHCVVDELYKSARVTEETRDTYANHNERVVTHVANTLLALQRAS